MSEKPPVDLDGDWVRYADYLKLTEKNDRLREVLEFYAEPGNYDVDDGASARAALEGK